MTKKATYTPMMKHYLELKEQHEDAIIFYRLGDFYEMFFEDAKTASSELDLVLTGRNAGVEERVPMCGIPHHAAKGYIQRLIQKGYKVAIVEQLEDPALAKGLVKRDVIKIVTPGTIMDEVSDEKTTVYIASLHDFQFGLAVILCEMTTGELRAQLIDKHVMAIQKVLLGNNVREIVIQEKFDKKIVEMIEEMQTITVSYHNDNALKEEYRHLLNGIEDDRVETAFGVLTNYLDETQKRNMAHLNAVEMVYENDFLQMDFSTKQNLELTSSLRSNSRSQTLWSFLDKCRSSMGSRLLKKWIEYPLVDTAMINRRLDAVEYLNDNFITKDELREHLGFVYDMERLSARVAYGSANPRDILRLIKTLEHTPQIFELFHDCSAYEEFQSIDPCRELYDMIEGAIIDNPPLTLKDGGVFVEGYNEELDQVREIGKNGKNWILELENKERERTGVKSLKIGYNRVFGYYIEVTKTNLDSIKDEFGYVRKQTLTNAERFITQELKDKEDAIVHAQERSIRLEAELFNHLLNQIKVYLPKLHDLSHALATIDALYALAEISSENGYTRPQFHTGHSIHMKEARHPILDRMMKTTRYVSNDLEMGEDNDILMITGPNMGGKSTYMRQTVLLVIMAQIGCFVPAKKAEMPIFDQIFTRIGASDDIMSGQSTFMVEMIEANNALQNATANSLILFDEIGRGTSTYDGMALAQAMIEYIMRNIKAKTLFSTHYHELTEMAEKNAGIRNVHVDVHEEDDKVTFLYRVLDGKADKSYGINVARLAHLPSSVLERAKQILDNLELQPNMVKEVKPPLVIEKENPQHMQIINQFKQVDVNKMTPMEAMQFLYELKEKMS
ncbi:DNA mismatch repair protein MutS [Erysipelotrichaceae bacterium I46]|uniref:DNA mismatch repair protein MutS n=1 Tax=Clostridium innocuum TaxID=1522 RepID=UPI00080C57D6|nr:DNA mismatch repair protein MutS [[Clostridium] innocuum]ANU67764.1 DNA mismatch repair protein MutS [Erysipelotrichaceae bacterium I46]ASU19809.1 DNA mismatch repair protein MutS [[Clostridium] innocuum]QQR24422.1 DNA mismatch repair protein MutS [[Clostridium] innocuum]